MTEQDRIADPGFTAAMNQTEAVINELRALGVPYDKALAVANRIYSTGLDRGLYLGLRNAGVPAATS